MLVHSPERRKDETVCERWVTMPFFLGASPGHDAAECGVFSSESNEPSIVIRGLRDSPHSSHSSFGVYN